MPNEDPYPAELSVSELIAELATKLAKGSKIASTLKHEVQEGANINMQQYRKWHGDWFLKTGYALLRYKDNSYHFYAFTKQRDSYLIVDDSDDLSPQDLLADFGQQLTALEELMRRLEDREIVQIRQRIAEQEHDQSARYWLKYDDVRGRLYLNDTILLASPRLDSNTDMILQQVFKNPNADVEIKGVSSTQISSSLRDLGITGTLKDMFFPRTSNKKLFFRPSISNFEFANEGHKEIKFNDFMRTTEK